jgi:hypothetical protein
MRARRLVVSLVVLLAAILVGGAVPLGAAMADSGAPVIDSPGVSDIHYAGYTGPFTVDFAPAQAPPPAGTYTYSISGDSSFSAQTVWDGTNDPSRQLSVAPLAKGSYTFTISDGAGHEATLAFTVRGPQPHCTLIAPVAVRVNAPEKILTGHLGADCAAAGVTYASWDIASGGRFIDLYSFNRTTTDTWKYGAYVDPLGVYRATPAGLTTSTDDVVAQNAPLTTIRLASRQTITASRAGVVVTLRGSVTRYFPHALGFRGWAGRSVVLSFRTCATCPWRALATRTTSATGAYVARVHIAGTRWYRAVVGGTSTVWAPPSATVRR